MVTRSGSGAGIQTPLASLPYLCSPGAAGRRRCRRGCVNAEALSLDVGDLPLTMCSLILLQGSLGGLARLAKVWAEEWTGGLQSWSDSQRTELLWGWDPRGGVEGFLQAGVWMRGEFSIQVIQVVSVPCPPPQHPILFGSLLCARLFAGRLSQAGVVSGLSL